MDKGVVVHNTDPVVTFEEPIEGETFEMSDPITFMAVVEDEESNPEQLVLEWTSDLAGLLEEGTTPSADGEATFTTAALEEGLHTLTLKATDPMGQIGSDYMTVNVESNCLADTDCDFDEDGYTEEEGDCDDNDDDRNPGASEIYNGVDDNCDDVIDEGTDAYDDDGDGYTELEGDCDDADPDIAPDAEEIEDGIDNDCDDFVDEGTDVYDDDEDGFAEADGDCDDADPAVNPDAEEVLNGIDDDCDGLIDEGSDVYDDDGDGYSEATGDCDDTDPSVHPDALEICDEIDNDCDGDIDADDVDTDVDGDTFSGCDEDCDDEDEDIHPDAPEICDEIDNDCDEDIDTEDADTDFDDDGYTICDEIPDCNDADASIFPGSIEVCDLLGADEDCDGESNEAGAEGSTVFFVDGDGDGYGISWETGMFCSLPETGYSANGDDCDDEAPLVSPAGTEVCWDGLDNDCDWAIDGADSDTDGDGDGFSACGATSAETDCDDTDPDVSPGDPEICGDDEDNDCDGATDEPGGLGSVTFYADGDGDGFGDSGSTIAACSVPSGYVANDDDCNDGSFAIKPTADEECDMVDNDCDGTIDEDDATDAPSWYFDGDDDGFGSTSTVACTAPSADYVDTSGDCNDSNDTVYPGAVEYCDGILNNCDLDSADGPEAVDQTTWFRDYDGDGYPRNTWSTVSCDMPSGFLPSTSSWDCNDGDFTINPGAEEVCDDLEVNEDCDDKINEEGAAFCMDFTFDGDEDGWGVTGDNKCLCDAGLLEVGVESNYTVPLEEVSDEDNVDCCDSSASTYPGALGWYTSPNSCGSYDKNCRDGEEKRWGDSHAYSGCTLDLGWDLECDIDVGWAWGDTPPCGSSENWVSSCSVDDVGYWYWGVWIPDYECDISYYGKSQECQ